MVGWFVWDGKGLMPASGIIPALSRADWKPWEVELKRGASVLGCVRRHGLQSRGIGGQCDPLAGMVLLLETDGVLRNHATQLLLSLFI